MINMGPEGLGKTLQFATDGIHFSAVQQLDRVASAAGFYRPEAFNNNNKGRIPDWGIEIRAAEGCLPGLGRVDLK